MDYSKINTIGLKIILIIILVLLFLIPLKMIENLSNERQDYRSNVEQELIHSWGGSQNLGALMVGVPVLVRETPKTSQWQTLWFSPDELAIKGEVKTELRRRGIYRVPIFHATLNLQGVFQAPDFANELDADILQVDWKRAILSLSLSDTSGLKDIPRVSWNGRTEPMHSSVQDAGLGRGVLSVPVDFRPGSTFSLQLDLRGSRVMDFYPLARKIDVELNSDWPDPSFYGSALPESHTVTGQGFQAHWSELNLNAAVPRMWLSANLQSSAVMEQAFGVQFLVPVDFYQRVIRALKYGFLFILVPFLIMFFMEVLTGVRVHFVQYIIVGLSNVVFYLLLLSLSEHIGFLASYIVSSAAITGLLFYYLEAVLKEPKRALIFVPIQVALYTLMYIMLNSTDFALLIGSIGVFIVLAVIMVISRKVDWYEIKKGPDRKSPTP